MADKGLRSWLGYKESKEVAPSENAVDRIRQLEAQLSDLRSRKDITSLSKEEFEILATETAMSIIRTAQQRESKANSAAERILNESKKSAATAIEAAQAKANSLLTAAESRGRKYIEAAESDAAGIIEEAERESGELLSSRKREASTVVSNAKKEADRTQAIVAAATAKVEAAKKVADEARAAQAKEVDKLKAIQSKLMAELAKAKNFRITLEQQRQLSLLEEANSAIAANTPNQYKVWPDRGFTGRSSIRSTESIRLAAVEYAKKQVQARKPYIWGAEGPNAFDCSGLVYAAYKSAGLGYPGWGRLNAALYFVATKRVSLNSLVPGDLLFYSYDGSVQNIHHISIYAGNGMMWEANSRKIGLIYSNMYSIKGLMPYGGRV